MSQLHVRVVVLSTVLTEGARQDDQDVPSNVAQLQKARENISSYSNKTNRRPKPKQTASKKRWERGGTGVGAEQGPQATGERDAGVK